MPLLGESRSRSKELEKWVLPTLTTFAYADAQPAAEARSLVAKELGALTDFDVSRNGSEHAALTIQILESDISSNVSQSEWLASAQSIGVIRPASTTTPAASEAESDAEEASVTEVSACASLADGDELNVESPHAEKRIVAPMHDVAIAAKAKRIIASP